MHCSYCSLLSPWHAQRFGMAFPLSHPILGAGPSGRGWLGEVGFVRLVFEREQGGVICIKDFAPAYCGSLVGF
jgi:hypothetical protein